MTTDRLVCRRVIGVHLRMPLLGLCLIDTVAGDGLEAACRDENRCKFRFSVMPLLIAGSTGSPCGPIVVLQLSAQ